MFNSRRSRGRSLLFVVLAPPLCLAAVVGPFFLDFGCGEGLEQKAGSTCPPIVTTALVLVETTPPTAEAASPATSSTGELDATPAIASDGVFSDLSRVLAPTPVYFPTYLPAGSTVAATWWPVMQVDEPEDYHGVNLSNPHIDEADGRAVAAQVVLRLERGWLVVLENFRGDLGDVAGKDVGDVRGHRARLYAVNGGTVVQWSDGGMWYAVFGKDVPADEVKKVALSMAKAVVDPAESR
jgi:hypothetical protein